MIPSGHRYRANFGGAYGSIGNYNDSVSVLRSGLEIATDYIELRKNLAVSYKKMGEYGKVITALEKIPAAGKGEERRDNEIME